MTSARRTILIIEDNAPTREIIDYQLSNIGFEVLQAENGRIGLDMFAERSPELVILDLRMPEVDGLEVLEKVTAYSPDTPVIILSGLGTYDDVIHALKLGAWDYITKPITDFRVLQHAISKALEKRDLLLENKRYKEELEIEVLKRTAELEAAYKEIKQEIEERKEAEKALSESEAKLRVLFDAAADPILLMDARGTILDINESMAREIGKKAKNIIGSCVWDLFPADVLNKKRSIISNVVATGKPFFIETERQGKWYDIAIYPIMDDENRVTKAAVFSRDITSRKWTEEELRELSMTDDLTGLFNRRGIMTLAKKQLKIAERMKNNLLLLYIDFDNMKQINDLHGHTTGDQALIETASLLQETFREADVIGRLGGDEFIVILSDKPGMQNRDSALKRLNKKLAERNRRENRDYLLSISIGTVYFDHKTPSTIEELLSRGDAMMYKNKAKKKPNRTKKIFSCKATRTFCQT